MASLNIPHIYFFTHAWYIQRCMAVPTRACVGPAQKGHPAVTRLTISWRIFTNLCCHHHIYIYIYIYIYYISYL